MFSQFEIRKKQLYSLNQYSSRQMTLWKKVIIDAERLLCVLRMYGISKTLPYSQKQ